jgi:hypothetical protein
MPLRTARDVLSRIFYQRCFYLFVLLLAFITVVPFFPLTTTGRLATNWINAFVVVATVAAVGRSLLSFVVVLLLAAPALWFQWQGLIAGDARGLAYSWMFGAALYGATTIYLLRYVFRPEVMTTDKLFGAAASYLMLGILWAYFYVLTGYVYPESFLVGGRPATPDFYESLYLSMTVLTSTGFGDISPLARQARAVCIVEQVVGALFIAILIARLAGVYTPNRRR